MRGLGIMVGVTQGANQTTGRQLIRRFARDSILLTRKRFGTFAAMRISSIRNRMTKQFGGLQSPATKISFLSAISRHPATIRIVSLLFSSP